MNQTLPLFKCRCSAISKIMSNSKSNPVLTEKQGERLRELREKFGRGMPMTPLTVRQMDELSELETKEKNGKKVILSDTCIEYLMEWYAWETAGKRPLKEQFEIAEMRKGKLAEGDSIALLSVVEGTLYEKNTERIENDFLSGEPDIYAGERIYAATKITDIKTCFDYPIFLKKINNGLDAGNEEQVQGYCDIP